MDSSFAKIDIAAAFAGLGDAVGLHEIARVNDLCVRIGLLRGVSAWHRHDDEDEMFWVAAGSLTVETRDRAVTLGEGEMLVIPAGVEHHSRADAPARVLFLHRNTTKLPAMARD